MCSLHTSHCNRCFFVGFPIFNRVLQNYKMFDMKIYIKCMILIWFYVNLQNVDSASPFTYYCKNGKFIPDSFYCDGKNDCGDNSDEVPPGCQRNWCSRTLRCDGVCKNITVRCNTKPDCLDGSDESNCGHELPLADCVWQKGKHLCEDNLRCIYLNHTCNGGCNCFDCSDEKPECLTDKEWEEYTKKASTYTCFRTPNGPHCCSEFDSLCHECSENQCEQKCIEFRQDPRCLCDENYLGVPGTNNRICVSSETKQNTLIYSTENTIGVLNLYANTSHIIKEKIEATALASAHDYVYYGTYSSGIGYIFKTSNSSDETHEITNTDSKIISIAIDWITSNIYFVTNSSKIVACSNDGKVCKQLKSSNVHSIGVAPRFGLLFWVETISGNSSQFIWKSGMDGSNETLLTICDKVSWPVAISVDELTEKLYFWTSLLELSYISFNGNNKKILQPKTQSPADRAFFAVFERKVYYSLLKSNQIHVTGTTSKLFSAPLQISYPNSSSVNHLYAYNPRLQRTKIQNPCHETCPDGLCLLRPFTSKFILNYTCFHDGLEVSSEQSDKEDSGFIYAAIIYAVVACGLIFLLKIGANFFIRWKKTLFKRNQFTETAVSLDSCRNNDLLLDMGECSNLKNDKNEFKKNENCNKLELLSDAGECSNLKNDVNEFKKNENCNKLELLSDTGECSNLKNDVNEFKKNENCSKLDNLEKEKMIQNNILE